MVLSVSPDSSARTQQKHSVKLDASCPGISGEKVISFPGVFNVCVDTESNFVRFDGFQVSASEAAHVVIVVIECNGDVLLRREMAPDGQPFAVRTALVPAPFVLSVSMGSGSKEGGLIKAISFQKISLAASIEDFVVSPLKCYWPFSYMGVTTQGDIYPCSCPAWLNDHSRYGSIRKLGVMNAWNDESMQDMRASFYGSSGIFGVI